jgi:chromosome partitioning protein
MRRSELNAHLNVTGILLTMVDQRTIINRQVVEYARREFGIDVPVFSTIIKRSVRFPESQALHQTILQYEPQGEGAKAYRALAQEILHGTT